MKHLLLLFLFVGYGSVAQNTVFDPETSKGQLYEYAEFANAGHSNYSYSHIEINNSLIFKPLKSGDENTGFTTDSYWVKFKLKNSSDQAKEYYLETARPITDVAELFQIDQNKKVKKFESGDQIPFKKRQVAHRATVFKIDLPTNSTQQFYLHLKSDGETVNLPLHLYTENAFWKTNYKQQLFLGLFYGLLLLAGIIYLFFYTSLRAKAFLYYGFYVFSIGLMQASLDGILYQYVFLEPGYISSRTVLLSAVLSNFFLLKYCEYFLEVSKKTPLFSYFFKSVYVLIGISALLILISPTTLAWAYPICNLNGLLSLVLILSTIATMRYKRLSIDVYFSCGILFLVIGLMGFVMNNLGLLPNNFITLNSAKFGTGFEIIFLSISMTNLIGRLRAEKEKSQEEALQKSEEISALKTYFMSNMSHELRTPLNTIMGIAEIELGKHENGKARKQFEIIKNASLCLLSNINDILDFEKIEKLEIKLKHEKFNPSIILNQINSYWKGIAVEKGLDYIFEMDYEVPSAVIGDQERFAQILNNVLANAVKFTTSGSVVFKMKSIQCAGNKYCFSLNISDTGIGMDTEFKKNIFDSFNQMKLDHKRKYGGIGLGLTIVKHLVELYGGILTIESMPQKGTSVFIDLYIEGLPEDLTKQKSETVSINHQNTFHVLVVEDNILNQMVMRKILNSYEEVSFSVVNNGQEAIEALQKDIYDIVLMDLQMPIMDGYEATKIIRSGELGKAILTIPIIAVTADAMHETHKKVLEIGMNDLMTKPVNRDLLFEKMKLCKNSVLKIA